MSEEVIAPKEKKALPKGKLIVIAVLVVVIAVAAVIGVMVYKSHNSPAAQLERAEAAGDKDAAQQLIDQYGDEIKGNADVVEIYNTTIEELERSFLAETIDYSAAIAELDRIQALDITGTLENLTKVRSSIESLNNSRIAFRTAESFFSSENYAEAIDQYKKVIETDPNFAAAAAKIESCYNNYRSNVLAEAESMVTAGSYESAIGLLESALSVLPNDATIQEKIILYTSKLSELEISDALTNAATYAEAGDYASAIRAIESQYKANPNNYQLSTRYGEYTQAYEQQVLAAADTLAAERKYDEAIDQIKSAQSLLPDSQPLKDKIAALESSKPTPLSNLGPINGGWDWNDGTPEDPFGNNYSGSINFTIQSNHNWGSDPSTISAEYRLDGKYTTLTGKLIPYTSIHENSTYKILVYTDDGSNNYQLVYTSPDIGRKTDAYAFEAPITAAKYVKINIVLGDEAAAIVTDLQLWPK